MNEHEIDISLIDVGQRIRDVEAREVEKLIVSMRNGQLNPIEVREGQAGRYILTTGAHRLAAARALGWEKIRGVVKNCSEEEARLREIDENLFRHELTPYDQANFLEERRRLWELVNGQIKRGGDRRSKVQICTLEEEIKRGASFYRETSTKFGISQDQVKRAFMRKGAIAPDVWSALRGTDAARNASILDKLRKLTLEEQAEFASTLADGVKVKVALRQVAAAPEIDPDERQFQALRAAWTRASDSARQRFLSSIKGKK